MKTAKIFKHGNSQAVRLPKEFQITYDQIMAVVGRFKGRVARRQPRDQRRKWQ